MMENLLVPILQQDQKIARADGAVAVEVGETVLGVRAGPVGVTLLAFHERWPGWATGVGRCPNGGAVVRQRRRSGIGRAG